MAVTSFGTNDSQSVSIWSKLTLREALKKTLFNKFVGKAKTSIIQRIDDLEKTRGDTIKFDILMQATGAGITGDNVLKGNEEAMVYYQDTLVIDQLRNAHSFRGMTQQRTVHDLRSDAQENLSDWYAGKFDEYMFRYLCGDTSINHGQAGLDPDSTHYVISGDVTNSGVIATDEASLGTNDQMALDDLDFAKEKAVTLTPPLRPAIIDGEEYFVAVLHPYSVTDIRLDLATNTSAVSWLDIQKYAAERGKKNPIFSGALGTYNNMILFESSRIYSPISNVRRNVLLGAQSGTIGFGNAYNKLLQQQVGSDNMFSWFEEVSDYGNETGVAAGAIFGMKKTRFTIAGTARDYGVVTITCYSAAH